jgi:hypothetical protein
MNLKQLQYLCTLADELHFPRAAHKLNITQPPLSIAIRNFEEAGRVCAKSTQCSTCGTWQDSRLKIQLEMIEHVCNMNACSTCVFGQSPWNQCPIQTPWQRVVTYVAR